MPDIRSLNQTLISGHCFRLDVVWSLDQEPKESWLIEYIHGVFSYI